MNIFESIKEAGTNPLTGSVQPRKKRSIRDYDLYQIFASFSFVNLNVETDKRRKNGFQYLPTFISIGISLFGWLCETN